MNAMDDKVEHEIARAQGIVDKKAKQRALDSKASDAEAKSTA